MITMKSKLLLGLAFAGILLAQPDGNQILGVWNTDDGDSKIEIVKCGENYCGSDQINEHSPARRAQFQRFAAQPSLGWRASSHGLQVCRFELVDRRHTVCAKARPNNVGETQATHSGFVRHNGFRWYGQ